MDVAYNNNMFTSLKFHKCVIASSIVESKTGPLLVFQHVRKTLNASLGFPRQFFLAKNVVQYFFVPALPSQESKVSDTITKLSKFYFPIKDFYK